MVLKEWKTNISWRAVKFDTIDLFLQIHCLPPNLMNLPNARKIGRMLGQVHKESLTPRLVVGSKYVRFRVEIRINKPFPAGFPTKEGEWTRVMDTIQMQ